jgi:hypothetical protein
VTEKHASIQSLIRSLGLRKRSWIVVDHWIEDDHAIGIAAKKDPRRLVYVASDESKPDTYYYECEVPLGSDDTDYDVTSSDDGVDIKTLVAVLERHLGGGAQ